MALPKKMIILAQSLEQPRIVKRIIEKSLEYESVEVYGFNRKIHAVKNYGLLDDYPNVSLNIVASFTNSKYLNRIGSYVKLLLLIYKKHGLGQKTIYVFGIDLRMVSSLILNSRIDYEISDIMWLYMPKMKKGVLRTIDNFLVRKSNKVIFTSWGFYDSYYKDHLPVDRTVIMENKFKSYGKVKPVDVIESDCIRIAYIGAFRYKRIIENLIKVIYKKDNIILNFYGDGDNSVVELIKENTLKYKNIKYYGAFKNPDDLEKIYSENNLNFVVYNNTLDNEKVAMPNKFYESGFFNIPIVCANNTYVGSRVLNLEMGWTCGINYEEISSFLDNLNVEDIINYHNKIKELDKDIFHC